MKLSPKVVTSLLLLSSLFVAVAALAVWEQRSNAAAQLTLPKTSRLVALADGRRLQLDCRGAGTPTVVFESGAGADGALEWSALQDSLASGMRACAYSRSGLLWSDPDDRPMTPTLAVHDLHELLERGNERCPCVLVAHSIGGPVAVHYTYAHPDDIVGLVLVDITHPDEIQRVDNVVPGMVITPSTRALAVGDALRWTGLPRLRDAWRAPHDERPSAAVRRALAPAHRHGQRREYAAIARLASVSPDARDLGDRPVVVLAAGLSPRALLGDVGASRAQLDSLDVVWRVLQEDIATWSRHARLEVVPDANHNIHHARPDRVAAAVREVIAAARQ